MIGGLVGRVVKRLSAAGPMGRVTAWRSKRFASLMVRAGATGNPVSLAARSVGRAALAAAAFAPMSIVLSVVVSPMLALVGLALLLPYVWPEFRLKDRAAQRREGVERELPFFSALVNVLGSAGVSLYQIFEGLAENDIFEAMKREALLVRRDVTIFGMNPNDSFERLASNHPSRRFREFLFGYTSKVRSGGDVASYLAGESGSLLRELEEGWARYASRVGVVGSMMITVFGVIPLLLMVVGVFSPGFSVVGLLFFTAVGVPLFTVLLVHMAARMQPAGEEPLHGKGGRSLLLCVPGLALGVVTGQAWAAVALALFAFFVAFGISVRQKLIETREVEEGLTRFMDDLMEFKRQEYDLTKAVLTIAAENRYNQHFDRLLAGVAGRIRAGVPLDEIRVDARSRLARLAFFLVGQMSRSGGGTVDTLYQLSRYIARIVEAKKNTRAEMRPYLLLSYVSPVLLAFGVTFVGGVMGSFGAFVRPGLSSIGAQGIQVGSLSPVLTQVSDLLIVVSAGALGLIGAKMTDFTVRNTHRASVNVGIAVAAMALMSAVNLHSIVRLGF